MLRVVPGVEAYGLLPTGNHRGRKLILPKVLADPVCATVAVAREKEYTDCSEQSLVRILMQRSGTPGERPGLETKKGLVRIHCHCPAVGTWVSRGTTVNLGFLVCR